MKKILLSAAFAGAALFATSNEAVAQPSSAIAPDFTLTDMDGTEHNLYSYLDEGKTVIMDMFATWCGPCIASIPSVEAIWEDHGPTGDNTIVVLTLEADASTSNEAATAAEHNMTAPLFDNGHTITNLGYQSGYFPTYFVVCPDRTWQMHIGGVSQTSTLLDLVNNCPDPGTSPNDARVLPIKDSDFFCGDTYSGSVDIQNYGVNALTSATVVAKVDGSEVASANWSGNLSQYEVASVDIDIALDATADVTFEITSPNGGSDTNMENNSSVQTIAKAEQAHSFVRVEIQLDGFGDEITWRVLRGNNSIAAQGGPYEIASTETISVDVPMTEDDCYKFIIMDSYGDGLAGGTTQGGTVNPSGYYKVSDGAGNVIAEQSGNFGETSGLKPFTVDITTVSIDENDATAFTMYPNPADDFAAVNFALTNDADVTLEIFDAVGKSVMVAHNGQLGAGNHTININTQEFVNGFYFVNLNVGEKVITKKLSVIK